MVERIPWPSHINTLICPKCGWSGTCGTAGHLTLGEIRALEIVDEHDWLIPRLRWWNYAYCPKCYNAFLEDIHKEEYEQAVEQFRTRTRVRDSNN